MNKFTKDIKTFHAQQDLDVARAVEAKCTADHLRGVCPEQTVLVAMDLREKAEAVVIACGGTYKDLHG